MSASSICLPSFVVAFARFYGSDRVLLIPMIYRAADYGDFAEKVAGVDGEWLVNEH